MEALTASPAVIGYASPTTGRALPWGCADGECALVFEVPSRVVVNNAET